MELRIYLPFTPQINEYLHELKQSLHDEFGIDVSTPRNLEILRVPIREDSKADVSSIVRKYLKGNDFKIRFVTKYNTEQISLAETMIEISVDERSWNTIVNFHKLLLHEIERYIDTSNPIILKGDTHHSGRPTEYVKRYGTDNVLNWYGASIRLAEEKERETRKKIYKFISDSHPLDASIKGIAEMNIS